MSRRACTASAKGKREHLAIDRNNDGRVLRYAAPLITETSCLSCHSEHGYHPGDIRGALSISIPIAWADAFIETNNQTIFLLGLLSVLAAAAVMLLLFNRLVARPMHQLSTAMTAFPEQAVETLDLPVAKDEIGRLGTSFTSSLPTAVRLPTSPCRRRRKGFPC